MSESKNSISAFKTAAFGRSATPPIETMLAVLKGTAHAAVMVAAWTGLSLTELRGLKWEDMGEDQLVVNRTYWHQIEGPTKTEARRNAVHLLPVVRAALAEHRKKNLHTVYVFEGPHGRPLDLATLGSKHIKSALEGTEGHKPDDYVLAAAFAYLQEAIDYAQMIAGRGVSVKLVLPHSPYVPEYPASRKAHSDVIARA